MPTVTIGDNTGDDYSGTEDNFIKSGSVTSQQGSSSDIEITKFDAVNHHHTLLSFSGIGSLPGTLTVSASTLYLKQYNVNATYNITAKKLNRNWVEDESTWLIWSTGNSWTTSGALHETDDRSATVTFDVSVDQTIGYVSMSSAQLAADVEDFADGTLSNYGWHLERTDAGEDGKWKILYSSDANDGDRPYLSVTYTVAAVSNAPIGLLHRKIMKNLLTR